MVVASRRCETPGLTLGAQGDGGLPCRRRRGGRRGGRSRCHWRIAGFARGAVAVQTRGATAAAAAIASRAHARLTVCQHFARLQSRSLRLVVVQHAAQMRRCDGLEGARVDGLRVVPSYLKCLSAHGGFSRWRL